MKVISFEHLGIPMSLYLDPLLESSVYFSPKDRRRLKENFIRRMVVRMKSRVIGTKHPWDLRDVEYDNTYNRAVAEELEEERRCLVAGEMGVELAKMVREYQREYESPVLDIDLRKTSRDSMFKKAQEVLDTLGEKHDR